MQRSRPSRKRGIGRWAPTHALRTSAVLFLVVAVLPMSSLNVLAAPPPNEIYYVPLKEHDVLQALDDIDQSGSSRDPFSPILSIVFLSVNTTGTIVYWDHWEDGYDSGLASGSPADASTEIWGDGNAGNGIAPGLGTDNLAAGDVIILQNQVPVQGASPGPYSPRANPASNILYDGGDVLGATYPIAVTRAAWAVGGTTPMGSLEAGAAAASYDFWFRLTPTSVVLSSFDATPQLDAIEVTWSTTSETEVLGFDLYRSESIEGAPVKLNETMLPAQHTGSPLGADYAFLDESAAGGVTYYYWLDLIEVSGATERHGPVATRLPDEPGGFRIYLPLTIYLP